MNESISELGSTPARTLDGVAALVAAHAGSAPDPDPDPTRTRRSSCRPGWSGGIPRRPARAASASASTLIASAAPTPAAPTGPLTSNAAVRRAVRRARPPVLRRAPTAPLQLRRARAVGPGATRRAPPRPPRAPPPTRGGAPLTPASRSRVSARRRRGRRRPRVTRARAAPPGRSRAPACPPSRSRRRGPRRRRPSRRMSSRPSRQAEEPDGLLLARRDASVGVWGLLPASPAGPEHTLGASASSADAAAAARAEASRVCRSRSTRCALAHASVASASSCANFSTSSTVRPCSWPPPFQPPLPPDSRGTRPSLTAAAKPLLDPRLDRRRP